MICPLVRDLAADNIPVGPRGRSTPKSPGPGVLGTLLDSRNPSAGAVAVSPHPRGGGTAHSRRRPTSKSVGTDLEAPRCPWRYRRSDDGQPREGRRGTPFTGVPRHRCGAGDRDRTGMASLEGLGHQGPSWLVRVKSGGSRAFHVPQRHVWRPEERLLVVVWTVASRVPRFADALQPAGAVDAAGSPTPCMALMGRDPGQRVTPGPSFWS
jgi:hypothetical protein